MRPFALAFAFAILCRAQTAVTLDPAGDAKEQMELNQAVSEAGQSAIDLIRALELHLKKYPESKQRAPIEKGLAKSAMDTNDNPRIIRYGEAVLQREPTPDQGDTLQLLDRVIRALVDKGDADQSKRAVDFAKRYLVDVAVLRAKNEPPGHLTPGQWSTELDKAQARALALQARGTGNAGEQEEAAKLARKSWDAYPTAEGAREEAFWLANLGRNTDAIEFYSNAFALEDTRTTEADRARDRARLGELYAKLNGSEKGLGDLILAAYDRTSSLLRARRAAVKARDPNAEATSIVDFTLPPVDKTAPALALASLKGKTLVIDFWATWCLPCRAQQPLIENVKKRFEAAADVMFVPVNADDDLTLVAPFVKEQGWANQGYFDGGLARQLTIANIPTVLVVAPDGQISSRLVGFIPERFEQMLAERVEEARGLAK